MDVRDKINELLCEYKSELELVSDGCVTVEQQEKVIAILDALSFYTTRFMLMQI